MLKLKFTGNQFNFNKLYLPSEEFKYWGHFKYRVRCVQSNEWVIKRYFLYLKNV